MKRFWSFLKHGWPVWLSAAVGFIAVWFYARTTPLNPGNADDILYAVSSKELIEFEDATRGGTECYVIEPVYSIKKIGDAACPDRKIVKGIIDRFMKETKTTAGEIRTARIWFTSQPINCSNCSKCQEKALGCTNGHEVAVLLSGHAEEWGVTLWVELCHVRQMSRHRKVDVNHEADCYPPGSV